jgi:hypothetical protein
MDLTGMSVYSPKNSSSCFSVGKTSTPRVKKVTTLVEVFLLYIIMHLVPVFITDVQFYENF